MKILFPSWTGYRFWGVEGDAGVEIVEEFVDFLDLVVDRSCASKAGEWYLRRQRHALRQRRRCPPGDEVRGSKPGMGQDSDPIARFACGRFGTDFMSPGEHALCCLTERHGFSR